MVLILGLGSGGWLKIVVVVMQQNKERGEKSEMERQGWRVGKMCGQGSIDGLAK